MDYDRLRELQAKFDENPRRYFAPLANEYRKAGNPKRAIEICRAHLAQMPGHMSGQVVYGQALFEGAEFEEARKVFEGAIVLDPENLIALRSLGDLALQAGNTDDARSYYARLLEADPKDTAVIALVAELDASPDGAPGTRASASEAAMSTASNESTFTVDFSFVDEPPAAPEAAASSAVEGLTSKQPEPESPLAQAEAGRAPPGSASGEAEPPFGLEHNYPAADAAAETPAQETLPTAAPMGPDHDALDEWPATSSFAGKSAEPFVNETMAQLYLQQGYKQLALRVYRQLSEMKPGDQSLKDRIAEIEVSQAAQADIPAARARREEPSIDSPPTSTPSREPDSIESPVRQEPRAEPEGIAARQPSIREFFATLGRRRPPRPAAAPAASRSASLDTVFAGATVSAKDARAASALAGAFSASARGTSPPPPPSASTPTPRGSPRLQAQESEEDVAKFRAWLDGLTGE